MAFENPSVNRWLEDKGMDHIDHALGRPIYPCGETYRNHFATDASSHLAAEFDGSPYWAKTRQWDDIAFYSVTDAGRQALDAHLSKMDDPWQPFIVEFDGFTTIVPAKTRSKAKYAYYLRVSDSWSELTFAAYSKRAKVRRAA